MQMPWDSLEVNFETKILDDNDGKHLWRLLLRRQNRLPLGWSPMNCDCLGRITFQLSQKASVSDGKRVRAIVNEVAAAFLMDEHKQVPVK